MAKPADGRLPFYKQWMSGEKGCHTCWHGWRRKAIVERETGVEQVPCRQVGCTNNPAVLQVSPLKGRPS